MRLGVAAFVIAFVVAACDRGGDDRGVPVPGRSGATKTAALARAERRMYDGAPPVIPHGELGAACTACHDVRGVAVEGLGFAPPSPHEITAGLSATSRCRQCHVPRQTDQLFRRNSFAGAPQDLRSGPRLHPLAPPVIPHPVFMRENCGACHDGPAAREEVRCSHPERTRCLQCHAAQVTGARFTRP